MSSFERIGGASLILGSLLFAIYSALFPVLLPIGTGSYDYVEVVLNPNWTRLAALAFAGIVLMLVGFFAAWSRMRRESGIAGAVGFLFVEAAYLLQACKVTWELFLYPIIASHPESAFLLRDAIIKHAPSVIAFRIAAATTIFVGIVLFCFALYRSGEYHKAAPVLIFVGALVYAVAGTLSTLVAVTGIFILAIGCTLLGVRLLKAGEGEAAQGQPTSSP